PGGTCPSYVAQNATDVETAPAIAWAGSYLVAWQKVSSPAGASGADVFGQRLDTGANPVGGALTISSAANDQGAVALAGDGASTFFAAWTDGRVDASNQDIFGTPVTTSVVVSNGTLLSFGTPEQRSLGVASSGSDYLVVWQDVRTGSSYDI